MFLFCRGTDRVSDPTSTPKVKPHVALPLTFNF